MKITLATAALISLGLQLGATTAVADNLPGTGTLTGTVVSEQPFRAARVYAHNADMDVRYMVYTNGGQYRAINLFPGAYEVSVEHDSLEADSQRIVVASGESATADFTLRESDGSQVVMVGATRSVPEDMQFVNYDEMYPPGEARDMLEQTCMSCHGRNFISLRSGLNAEGWDAVIGLMIGMDESVWGDRGAMTGIEEAVPMLPESITISPEQRAELVEYLAAHFGPGTSPRMVANDEQVPLDEAELGKAMWIEYIAPALTADGEPADEADAASGTFFQEQFFDLHGNVWLTTGGPSSAITRLDPRTATWSHYPLPEGWFAHGIVTDPEVEDTELWFAGRGYDVAHLDPQTGEVTPYGDTSSTLRWGGHTPVFDSKGTIWYTGIQEDRLGKWDRETDELQRWTIPTAGGRPYGILVDHDDNVWFGNLHTCTVTRFDPETEEFTEYVSPSEPCALRRPGLDSSGNIWYGSFSDGMLGKLDPETGEMTEWPIGRFAEPYETYVDLQDNVWVSDGGRNMLARFTPETESFTYYPGPGPHTDRPKMHITRDGAVWAPNRGASMVGRAPARAGVLYPDMDRMTTFGAYFAVENGRAVGTGSPPPPASR